MMKKSIFIKTMLVITAFLLLVNIVLNILPGTISAGAIRRYKVERVITTNDEGAFSQLWVKMNDIMNTYKKGSLVSVVKHSSDDKILLPWEVD